jgi:hypothetical protein
VTVPQDLAGHAQANVALAYRRVADAALAAVEQWSYPTAPLTPEVTHRRIANLLEVAEQQLVNYDSVRAGLARGRRAAS